MFFFLKVFPFVCLESSYHAVRASFQAVLGVAEHFTKMKLQISQVDLLIKYALNLFNMDNFYS